MATDVYTEIATSFTDTNKVIRNAFAPSKPKGLPFTEFFEEEKRREPPVEPGFQRRAPELGREVSLGPSLREMAPIEPAPTGNIGEDLAYLANLPGVRQTLEALHFTDEAWGAIVTRPFHDPQGFLRDPTLQSLISGGGRKILESYREKDMPKFVKGAIEATNPLYFLGPGAIAKGARALPAAARAVPKAVGRFGERLAETAPRLAPERVVAGAEAAIPRGLELARAKWLATGKGKRYVELRGIVKMPKETLEFEKLTQEFLEIGMSPKEKIAWRKEKVIDKREDARLEREADRLELREAAELEAPEAVIPRQPNIRDVEIQVAYDKVLKSMPSEIATEIDNVVAVKFASLTAGQGGNTEIGKGVATLIRLERGQSAVELEKSLRHELLHSYLIKNPKVLKAERQGFLGEEKAVRALEGRIDVEAVTPPLKPPVEPPVPPARPPLGPQVSAVPEDPVPKLTALIESAKPVRAETEILKTGELGRRSAIAESLLQTGEGRQAFQRSKGALKGELPSAQFAPPGAGLSEVDVASLFNRIRDADIKYFNKLNTSEALEKLLLGQIPTRGDIQLLEKMFGPELAKAILRKRPFGTKLWENFLDAWNLPRAVLASWDLSAPLRQGAVLAPRRLKEWAGGFKPMLKAFGSEKSALETQQIIQSGKYASLRQESKLFEAPIDLVSAKLSQREEVFMSNFARYIPLIRRSERAYVTFLNKFRADVFDTIARQWEGTAKTAKDYKELALFINRATGRGGLGPLESSAPFLSGVLFSPRLQASRILLLNSLLTGTTPVRKEAAKTLLAFVGTGVAILSILKLSGAADVNVNPKSADFGKIRIGKTRLDGWGGFQQYARFLTQLVAGERTSTITGATQPVDRLRLTQQFFRSKLMPTVSIFYDLLEGRTFSGEKLEFSAKQAYQRFAPIFVQDLLEAVKEEGLVGGFIASPGLLGVGVSTYDIPNWPELAEYYEIQGTTPSDTVKGRQKFRETHPDIDAKLFILGQVTTLRSPQATQRVSELLEEEKLAPEDIKGLTVKEEEVERLVAPVERLRPMDISQILRVKKYELSQDPPTKTVTSWHTMAKELESPTLAYLNDLWYGKLVKTKLRFGEIPVKIAADLVELYKKWERRLPSGQAEFMPWIRRTLQQIQELSSMPMPGQRQGVPAR